MKNQNTKVDIVYIGRYNESEALSGPEKTAKRIFGLSAQKYSSVFIQYFFDGNKYSLGKKLFGLEESVTQENLKIYTSGLIRLFILLLKLKPKLIHIITFERFASFAVYYARLKKVKTIYNSHGIITHEDSYIKHENKRYSSRNRKVEKLLLEKCSIIVFPSDAAKAHCSKYYNMENAIMHIIPNGIDAIFHFGPVEKYSRDAVVFFAGNELHTSGRDFLKKFLAEPHTGLNLYIIGDKNYFSAYNEFGIFKFDIMDSNNLAELYRNKDIFLSINEYDTFSISTAEAMASGLIPIVTKQTGISSMVFNDVNGYVIDFGDVEQLKKAIGKLRIMIKQNKEIIRNNSKSIYHKLKWERIFEQYESIYSINN